MTIAAPAVPLRTVRCGGCEAPLAPLADGPLRCPSCNWTGEAYLFSPRVLETQNAEAALPDDATCIHHPRKKAVAVCAGTGDYICALCSVELNGQTYSAEYLNAAGKDKVGKAFDRELPRPDTQIRYYFIFTLIPYINFLFIPFACIWIPHAFMLYAKALRMRRENPIFARLMTKSSVIILPILLSIFAFGWLFGAAALVFSIMEKHR